MSGAAPMTTTLSQMGSERIASLVDGWVEEGVVPAAGAERVRSDLARLAAAPSPGERRTERTGSLLVEGLAYVGGAVVVAGTLLVTARYWSSLGSSGRLGTVVTTALALLVAGLVVPARRGGASGRLRAVTWLGSTASVAGSLALLSSDVLGLAERDQFLLVAVGTAAYAGALWMHTRSPLQQVVMMAAFAVAAAALLHRLTANPDLPGVGVWAVCLAWAFLGWRDVLEPGRMALALGTAGAVVGGMLTEGADAGIVLSLVTVAAAVTCSILLQDLLVLGVAAAGALFTVPVAMGRWFPDSLAAALALVVLGLALVGTAIRIARRRGP
jgi:hypothetical protein